MSEEIEKVEIPMTADGPDLSSIDRMFRFAQCYLQSGLCPPAFRNPQALVIAWVRARELGIPYMQALEGMSVINNRLGLMGDLALALCERSGLLEDKRIKHEGEGDTLKCTVEIKRKNREWKNSSFSVAEAKKNGLLDRNPTWRGYPKRMTYYRALGFILRDEFSDVLKGMVTVEELQDYPTHDEEKLSLSLQRSAEERAEHPEEYVEVKAPPPPAHVMTEPAFDEDKGPEKIAPFREEGVGGTLSAPKPPPPKKKAQQQPSAPEPDELDLGPLPAAVAAVASAGLVSKGEPPPELQPAPPPPWKEHVILGVTHVKFHKRKIGELKPEELAIIEQQWLPAVRDQWDDATDEQRNDYSAFEAAIAWHKLQRPW